MSPFHYFFYGLAFFQLVYIAYNSWLFRRPDLIRYFLFCVLMTFYVVSVDFLPSGSSGRMSMPLFGNRVSLWQVCVLFFGGVNYMSFIRYLINAAEKHPVMNRIVKWQEKVVVLFSTSLLLYGFLFTDLSPINYLVAAIYFLMLPVQLYVIYTMIIHRTTYTALVLAGTLLMLVFFRIGMTSPVLNWSKGNVTMPFPFILTGLGLNFLFINLSLIFKSKEMQDEKLGLEIRKHDELNRQRDMISNDLHDDTGATLSSLYLYSSIAESVVEKDGKAAREHIRRISDGLRQVMEQMNDIIWAVRRDEYSEKTFSSYIKDYYYELMDAAGVQCVYDVDKALEGRLTNISLRRNLLLITKEVINNAMKHSGASHINLSFRPESQYAVLTIADNGSGFNPAIVRKGHGMTSINQRVKDFGGICRIDSDGSHGTSVIVSIPIDRISD